VRVAAYVYPGWHAIPERDVAVRPGFTEWDLVEACRPRFEGHVVPDRPLLGRYDDRDPTEVGRRIAIGRRHGLDAFVHGLFWCRGKRVFEDALDLGSEEGARTPFAVMWANRMPRHVLPVTRADLPVIEGHRLVPSDVADFEALVAHVGTRYMARPNYLRVDGRAYFSIFDSTFFLRELGPRDAARAIRAARARLRAEGLPDLHLAAIDPAPEAIGLLRDVGFDSVTHYVLLPEWKGPSLQDYATCARRRAGQWAGFAAASGLPYVPAVATAWDASPRALDFGRERPGKYPWSPVVTGATPALFGEALRRACGYARATRPDGPLVFVASWNEWSEGHALEPGLREGTAYLEALRDAKVAHPFDRVGA
jgi:hypothetical protein